MNPPSALYGAMNKERKPFTYTPGGLDLSEIKSERMAKRLIRNAMNQGVPEQPVSHIQSPPTPSALNVPNFNCLPVQVFPTFPLPINPKSLLKSRTNQQKEPCQDESLYSEQMKTDVKPISSNQCFVNNNENVLRKFISSDLNDKTSKELLTLPEYNIDLTGHNQPSYENVQPSFAKHEFDKEIKSNVSNDIALKFDNNRKMNEENKRSHIYEPKSTFSADISNQPLLTKECDAIKPLRNLEGIIGTVNNQNEVKAVKSELKTENDTADQNGDTNVEAAVTVKLPGKKSTAKTETKVEVVKNILPDGSTKEIKTTTTRTTINGKTEITTNIETTIIPKEDDLEDEEYVEEEEEEEQEQDVVEDERNKSEENLKKDLVEKNIDGDIGEQESVQNICKVEESVVSNVIEKVVVTQSTENEENSEVEEKEEETEETEIVEKIENEIKIDENIRDEKEDSEEEDEEEYEVNDEEEKEVQSQPENAVNKEDESEEEIQEEVPVAIDNSKKSRKENEQQLNNEEIKKDSNEESINENANSDQEEEEITSKESCALQENEQPQKSVEEPVKQTAQSAEENKEEIVIEVQVLKPSLSVTEESDTKINTAVTENEVRSNYQTERNIPLREPSVPLEKVEDVEIKPIGQIISKSHTENTEIITTSIDKPTTGLSTQTAYNRIENIVTVNRTTKTLDHAYEQIEPPSVPAGKTYFSPTVDALSTSPQPSKLYHPIYQSEPQNQRSHSLLLDRLSVDRQMPPADLYQSNYQSGNQNYEQNQWTQEPQSEVLTVSNVKPSTITKNQQWYQQTKKEDISYNYTAPPSVNLPSQQWYPQKVQSQPLPPTQPRSEYQPQPQLQSTYVDKSDIYKETSNNFSCPQQNIYPSYTPKPTSWVNNMNNSTQTTPSINIQPSNFSYPAKDPVESYQKPAQQFSSYVPPPWEQESTYVPENESQNYYPSQASNKFASSVPPSWTPAPTSKFSKPKPTSYIPPAPNQSFVKPVVAVEPPKMPGRKTYYSEYERRYISVPESTYIPTENKFQAQPNPSPKYYYDNNEPAETVEHEWRKELREFSEKTQSQTQFEQSSVKPPWEEDPKYYVPKVSTEYTPTPTWSQTLRPNSGRERSFESEFVRSKEMPRTNTLGRGRPQSSYVKSNISAPIPERVRGVSVDRYNPNNYNSPIPSEYPPVQSHTLDPSIGAKTYHNPNVPAYHSRASAEPREQSAAYPQARQRGEAKAPPVQSRSFKYLQWITGTED